MQLKHLFCLTALALAALQGCKVSTQLPLKAEDIRICGDTNILIGNIKRISAEQSLDFHYGTHTTDYGTQATFRLIGHDYEFELFNSMSQSDYTLRVYALKSEKASEHEAELAFGRLKLALDSATSHNCK